MTDDYPRPQLVRDGWVSLDGPWEFATSDTLGEPDGVEFDRTIVVPFPPESPASGTNLGDGHTVLWYRRGVDDALLSTGDAVTLLHFGAVDYEADVWFDGRHLAHHAGGHTPFTVSLPTGSGGETHTLVVRAVDDPLDVAVPRGKQDWRTPSHAIWYERTSGIWQPVWLEVVPRLHVQELAWTADLVRGTLDLELRLSALTGGTSVAVALRFEGSLLAEQRVTALDRTVRLTLDLARQRNGQQYEELLWSPEHPRLLDAVITVTGGGDSDTVSSYAGLRSAAVDRGRFLLNDHPYYVRSVLDQGYRSQTHLASRGDDELRAEVQLIKDLGFNAVRVHQKVEDPRFLEWADRLGLLVWGEMANAYEFSARAVGMLTREWIDVVARDRSHPSIVTWMPFNESWGVQHLAHDPAQQAYVDALASLTRALDPSRPVISNDGWEHRDSDIVGVHDYSPTGAELTAKFGDEQALARSLAGPGPVGRRLDLTAGGLEGRPVMLTEFGGINFARGTGSGDWGYSTAATPEAYAAQLADLLDSVRASSVLAGFCYTQLMDTGSETNGLVDVAGVPKLPIADIRRMVRGDDG